MSKLKAESKPLTEPLPGGSGPGTSVVVEPLLGGSLQAPPQFFESTAKRFTTLRMLGVGTPRSKWWLIPVPAYLITHPTVGPVLVDTGLHASVAAQPAANLGKLIARFARPRIEPGRDIPSQLRERGLDEGDLETVVLTHLHFDHAEGLVAWPMRRTYVHRIETEAPYAQVVSGPLENAELEVLDGDEGEIEPGVRWMLTPGHSDGLISLLVDTDDGLVVIASDCVGPLPEYFDEMDLPEDFGPEREELLRQWQRIRDLDPAVVIPGHNPPVELR